jgi:hypothetical protein
MQPSIPQLEAAVAQGDAAAKLHLGNSLLHANAPQSPQFQRGLKLLHDAAESEYAPAAKWVLGAYYLDNLLRPDSIMHAVTWMQQAAEAGVGMAIDRMANIYLRGIGVDYRPDLAVKSLSRLADAGYQNATWEVGYLTSSIAEVQDAQSSVNAFARGCAMGHPMSYVSLALRYAQGIGVQQDTPFAYALFQHAAKLGAIKPEEFASLLDIDQVDLNAAQEWLQALASHASISKALSQSLTSDFIVSDSNCKAVARMQQSFAEIGHPSIHLASNNELSISISNQRTLATSPSSWQWLSQSPRVAVGENFITVEERMHILSITNNAMIDPARYSKSGSRGNAEIAFFDGAGVIFGNLNSNAAVRVIERRIAETCQCPVAAIDQSSVISYAPGQQYKTHVDYLEQHEIEQNFQQNQDAGGQRVATVLICLRAPEDGGVTEYPDAGLVVSHSLDAVVIHYNTLPDGSIDRHSIHHGTPVKSGEKWLLRTGTREKSRYMSI